MLFERLAHEGFRAFNRAADAFGLSPPDDTASLPGWMRVAEVLLQKEDEAKLGELAHEALTNYLAAAGLPVDSGLADARWKNCWCASVVLLHGLIHAGDDRDDLAEVEESFAQWVEEHKGAVNV